MENVLAKYDINLPQDKIKVLSILENEISTVYSQAEKDIYIQMLSKKLDVDAKSIKADVSRISAKNARAYLQGESQKAKQTVLGYQDKVNPDYAKAPAVAKSEEVVLGLLLLFAEHRKKVFENSLLVEDDFYTDLNKRIFSYVKRSYENGDEFANPNESFAPDEIGRMTKIKLARMNLENNGDTVLDDSIKALKSSMQKKTAEKATSADDLMKYINSLRASDSK